MWVWYNCYCYVIHTVYDFVWFWLLTFLFISTIMVPEVCKCHAMVECVINSLRVTGCLGHSFCSNGEFTLCWLVGVMFQVFSMHNHYTCNVHVNQFINMWIWIFNQHIFVKFRFDLLPSSFEFLNFNDTLSVLKTGFSGLCSSDNILLRVEKCANIMTN